MKTIRDYEDDEEAHEILIAPPDWDGPAKERRCTDCFCLLMLLVAWAAMSLLGLYAINQGDDRLIWHPLDYDGNICGVDFQGVDMTNYPYLLYVNSFAGGVCVKECPHITEGMTQDNTTDVRTLITYNGIWQTEDGLSELPHDFVQVANYSLSDDAISCTTEKCFPNNTVEDSWESAGISKGFGYAYYVGDTYEFFNRCYLTSEAESLIDTLVANGEEEGSVSHLMDIYDANAFVTNFYGDLWLARYYILGFGFGVSLLISLVYMLLLRIPCLLSGLVWMSILTMILLVGLAGWFADTKATEWASLDPPPVRPQQIDWTQYAAYGLYAFAGILALMACCWRNSIQLAVTCVMQAGAAINSMGMLLVVPFLQSFALLLFTCVFGYYAVNLASMGEITTQSFPVDLEGTEVAVRVYEFNTFVTRTGWYLLFCFFWTASFLGAVGDMSVAVAVSKWYFTIDKSRIHSGSVWESIGVTLRYHLGTCAFGSLIIAIIQWFRALLNSLQKRIEEATSKSIAQSLLCCCQCCLCCMEKCVNFINKNAFIQCAIFGTPFVTSGRQAFFLILRNASRTGALTYVSAAVLWVGKVLIAITTTAASYYCIVEYMELELYSYGGPVFLIFVISYFVAGMFMGVFEISILTILHCFVADEEMFGGRSRYAEQSLTTWVDDYGAEK